MVWRVLAESTDCSIRQSRFTAVGERERGGGDAIWDNVLKAKDAETLNDTFCTGHT